MPGNTVHARRTVVGRCGVGRRGVRQRWRAACCAVGAAAPVPRGAWQGCGAELRGQAARPLARMERRVCGVKGRGSAGCIEGPCTGGAHERELGALQRKPRRLHLLARHLHLWCVAWRHVSDGCTRGLILTGHAPGRGAIGPDSSRAALRPSSSALGPGFKVYAAVSSAMAARVGSPSAAGRGEETRTHRIAMPLSCSLAPPVAAVCAGAWARSCCVRPSRRPLRCCSC
jgi:hypothetical protein